jgi:Flp pilus assembly protein TadD
MADKAMSQIQTALALAPSDATTLENIAVTYESLGQREKAKLYLQKAVAAGYPPVRIQGDPELQELLKDTSFRLDGKQ